jgi:hypothetical protein
VLNAEGKMSKKKQENVEKKNRNSEKSEMPMSSKWPLFGRLIAIFKKIDDYIAVNR